MSNTEFKGIKGIHITHLNVRSLLHKIDSFRIFLDDSNISIATLSETWLSEAIPDSLVNIPGYTLLRNDRKTKSNNGHTKTGGGVALYVKDHLPFDDTTLNHLNKSTDIIETQWVILDFEHAKSIIICNLYRPPQGNTETMINLLMNDISSIQQLDKYDLFILGDMNINFKKTHDLHTKALKSQMTQFGLKQYISEPTRYNKQGTHSIIDLIFSNSNHIYKAGVCNYNLSDHELVYITKKKTTPKPLKTTFLGRTYKCYDKQRFQSALLRYDWNNFYTLNSADEAWDILLNVIETNLNLMCPIKEIKIKKVKEEWLTNELLEQIKFKDTLLIRAKKSNKVEDWERARQIRNQTKTWVKRAKADYIVNKLNQSKGEPKKFWKTIKQVIPDRTINKEIILKDHATNLIIPKSQTADFINKFFVNVGPNLAKNCKSPWNPVGIPQHTTYNIEKTTSNFVSKLIKDIDCSKSSAIDYISTKVLKDAFECTVEQITYIFNLSIQYSQFPTKWKCATVVPLKKDGNKQDVGNLRPISLLPLPGKLLEKVIHHQTMKYLELNNILSSFQSGFRPDHSTTSTVAKITDKIISNMERGQLTYAIYIDFSKAFDTIDHDILLNKLQHLGFTGKARSWFKSYLKGRSQTVKANETKSKPYKITHGVPQGSVLGPLMFLLYINDISESITFSDHELYADDTILICAGPNPSNTQSKLQSDLSKLAGWCESNKLTINFKKTMSMVFGSRHRLKQVPPPKFKLNNKVIGNTTSYKYLGLTLDSTLSFDKHTSNLIKTVTNKTYVLRKIRPYLNAQASLQIYKSMLLPILDYGDFIYSSAPQKNLKKLQRLQNSNIRLCLSLPPLTRTNDIHRLANLNLLEDRRNAHLLNQMYKRSRNSEYADNRNLPLRSFTAPILKVPNFQKYRSKQSVIYRGSTNWNLLPPPLRSLPSYEVFKHKQKVLMLTLLT